MATEGMMSFSVFSVIEDVLRQCRLDENELVPKKIDEESSRRYEAGEWLRKIVGVVYSKDLPAEPSEQDFRLGLRSGIILCTAINKLMPGTIPKVVDAPDHTVIIPDGAGLTENQYFDNVENFLKAAEDMGLPLFEASDLEQEGETKKVVDCVLGLKSFHDWKVAGGIGTWKYNANASAKPPIAGKPFLRKNSEPILSLSSISRSSSLNMSEKSFDCLSTEQYNDLDFNDVNNSRTLNLLIRALLKDKKKDEIPNIIECMLSRVVEEIESRIAMQNDPEFCQAKASTEIMSVSGQNASPSDYPKAETQNISPTDSPKAETQNATSTDSPKAETTEPQIVSATDPPKAETQENNEEDTVDKGSETDKVRQEVKSQQAILLEAKDSLLKKCKSLFVRQDSNIKNNEEDTAINKCSETDKVSQEVKSQQEILLEAKDSLLKKCKLLLVQQDSNIKELKGTVHVTKETVELLQKKYHEEFSHLGKHLQTLADAASGYKKVLEENRKLYNQVQDLKGNIRVYCRVRPFLPDQENGFTTVENFEDKSITISTPSKQTREGKKLFTFNKVFGPAATQAEVFTDMQPLVRSVLDGYNVCIFAYGQTGAGKTYTMTGPDVGTEETYGVNYRALNDLFFLSEERKATISYEVSVQMMEIYNEQVRDLLATGGTNKKLEIRNSSQNGINVPDASRLPVSTTDDVISLMTLGHKNRTVSSTAMNDRSSRSHSCMTVHVQGKDLTSGASLRGCMHLVDLAGSERVDKSEVTGDRLKEATHINKSLSALGDVIAALATKNTHVPYRNSKLTQLLQDSLGGQAKTLMFVHISPEADAVGETISTLKFAERVATVELGAARTNKDTSDVKELKDQICNLKGALSRKEEEMEQFVRSITGTPESMSVKSNNSASSSPIHPSLTSKSHNSASSSPIHPSLTSKSSNSAASSPVHPSLASKSSNSAASSPVHPSLRAPKDASSTTGKTPEKTKAQNDQNSEPKVKKESHLQRSRRRSLDPDDILSNEAHWPPLSAVKVATGGDRAPTKKNPPRKKSLGTVDKPKQQQPPSFSGSSTVDKPKQQQPPSFSGSSSTCDSTTVANNSDDDDNDDDDDDDDDNADGLSVAPSDSSEAVDPQINLSEVSTLPNGTGSKIRKPQAKAPAKGPDMNKSTIPTVPVRRVANEAKQGGSLVKRKLGNAK